MSARPTDLSARQTAMRSLAAGHLAYAWRLRKVITVATAAVAAW
jgi:hypothetical protein